MILRFKLHTLYVVKAKLFFLHLYCLGCFVNLVTMPVFLCPICDSGRSTEHGAEKAKFESCILFLVALRFMQNASLSHAVIRKHADLYCTESFVSSKHPSSHPSSSSKEEQWCLVEVFIGWLDVELYIYDMWSLPG